MSFEYRISFKKSLKVFTLGAAVVVVVATVVKAST